MPSTYEAHVSLDQETWLWHKDNPGQLSRLTKEAIRALASLPGRAETQIVPGVHIGEADEMVKANHRCLDLQYALDASEARREEVAEKIISFVASFACPGCGEFIDLPDIKRLQADVKEYDISDHISRR